MAPKLHQILAVEKNKKTRTNQTITKTYHDAQKQMLFGGLSRTYAPKFEDGDVFPGESTQVQVKGGALVEEMVEAMVELYDITATKDFANTKAKADVKIGDQVILTDVPVPFLIFLEKQLTDVVTFIKKLPVLDPADEWNYDGARGVYVTPPVDTFRTKKVLRNHVKAQATDKHPAQVETYTEDEVVGTWTAIKSSGAFPQDTIDQYLRKAEQLREAVQFAREEANGLEVENKTVGKAVLDYIFA